MGKSTLVMETSVPGTMMVVLHFLYSWGILDIEPLDCASIFKVEEFIAIHSMS